MIINFTRYRLVCESLQEAQAGPVEYRDIKHSKLLLDGEILVSSEEVQDLEQQFGIEKPALPVDEPFQNWKDFIKAVKERTPESRQIIRYLEDFGYQDLLKIKNEQLSPDGTIQIRWDNFLLPADIAQQAGFKDGADYNRKMFAELLKHAPRTLRPEVFGGRKLMRGAVGSQRELKKRREPMVDHIVEETKNEVIEEVEKIFGVLPEDWSNILIGENGNKIKYFKDPTAIHLGKSLETVESTEQHEEISRWKRVLQMLSLRKDVSSKDAYNQAAEEVRNKLDALERESTKRFEIIYIAIAIPLGDFHDSLVGELRNVGYEDVEDRFVTQTSLKNLPKLFSLLDPLKTKKVDSRFGMRNDFYDVVFGALMEAFGGSVERIIRIDAAGNIYFTKIEDVPKGDDDYELSLKAAAQEKGWIGQRAAELLKDYEKSKTDIEEIADSIEY
jgi:hypothetical protein